MIDFSRRQWKIEFSILLLWNFCITLSSHGSQPLIHCIFSRRCKWIGWNSWLANGFGIVCGHFISLWRVGLAAKTTSFPAHLLPRLATAPWFTLEKQMQNFNVARTWTFCRNTFSGVKCVPCACGRPYTCRIKRGASNSIWYLEASWSLKGNELHLLILSCLQL